MTSLRQTQTKYVYVYNLSLLHNIKCILYQTDYKIYFFQNSGENFRKAQTP